MNEIHYISSEELTFERIEEILNNDYQLELSESARDKIVYCRDYLDKKLKESEGPIYGINTGFGSLHDHSISKDDLGKLQENLVKSHACGTGKEIPQVIVRLMILLKIQALSYGNSGVQISTVRRLIEFFNHHITPIVYEFGSLGASGDLAPLAHMSLPLIGEGEVWYEGKKQFTRKVYEKLNWEPIRLQSKEGLALLNGTQFMSAYGVYCMIRTMKISKWADVISAISLDAFDGKIEPFHHSVNRIRKQKGQLDTARMIISLLKDSELIHQFKKHIQDPYSFRCIPQVHGASKDTFDYVKDILSREINAVTDNPTIIPEEDMIVSAGNFHGQPLALALDYLCIALSELGNISERRIYQLLSGKRGLPSFLIANPGLNSGFMIPQYSAASIVSKNKQLSVPASVDSIESSQGQEDHVSMGANAAVKAFEVVENVEQILAIELFNAAQALEFRRPMKSSSYVEDLVSQYRQHVKFIENDKVMYGEIQRSLEFIREVEVQIPD